MHSLKPGNIYASLYVLIMALSLVWISQLQIIFHFHQSIMLLAVSAAAVIFYNAINIKSLKTTYQSALNYPLHWFLMSFSFAMTWWLIYFSTIHASPDAVIVIFYLVISLCACLSEKNSLNAGISALALIASYIFIPKLSYLTLSASILCGTFGYLYMKLSSSFAEKTKLNATQVLAVRFNILFLISLIHSVFFQHLTKYNHNAHNHYFLWTTSLLILVIFNLAPNYCVQKGIVSIGTNNFSRIITLTPATTFVMQGIATHKWNIWVLAICLSVSIFLAIINT